MLHIDSNDITHRKVEDLILIQLLMEIKVLLKMASKIL